jgi:hypothetical protein
LTSWAISAASSRIALIFLASTSSSWRSTSSALASAIRSRVRRQLVARRAEAVIIVL